MAKNILRVIHIVKDRTKSCILKLTVTCILINPVCYVRLWPSDLWNSTIANCAAAMFLLPDAWWWLALLVYLASNPPPHTGHQSIYSFTTASLRRANRQTDDTASIIRRRDLAKVSSGWERIKAGMFFHCFYSMFNGTSNNLSNNGMIIAKTMIEKNSRAATFTVSQHKAEQYAGSRWKPEHFAMTKLKKK